jgi:hypothetical protein
LPRGCSGAQEFNVALKPKAKKITASIAGLVDFNVSSFLSRRFLFSSICVTGQLFS